MFHWVSVLDMMSGVRYTVDRNAYVSEGRIQENCPKETPKGRFYGVKETLD